MELRRALAAAAIAAALTAPTAAGSTAPPVKTPHVTKVRCVAGCAGIRRAAEGSLVRFAGRHLAATKAVRFPGAGGRIGVKPRTTATHFATARVPEGAISGRPALLSPTGPPAHARARLTIVPGGELVGRRAFKLLRSNAHPSTAFFDGGRVRLSYRFQARSRTDLKLKIVRASNGNVVDHIIQRDVTPFSTHAAAWRGLTDKGKVPPAGSYVLRIGRLGGRGDTGTSFTFLPFEFPVRGPHSYGGSVQRFGAPRSGGRVHQGQDVFSPCGTREVAARGGHVQAEGYDPVLYGNWLVIDGRRTSTDYRYVHLQAPTPLKTGERVRTGQTVGHVGNTGNARTVGCMLHLEEWPSGWQHGNPIDPLPDLLRWDGWS